MSSQEITTVALRSRRLTGPKIAMLTAYDATMARLLDEGGADVLLVGDSKSEQANSRDRNTRSAYCLRNRQERRRS
jgi:ketopantoate hydroxymethyltransferase